MSDKLYCIARYANTATKKVYEEGAVIEGSAEELDFLKRDSPDCFVDKDPNPPKKKAPAKKKAAPKKRGFGKAPADKQVKAADKK